MSSPLRNGVGLALILAALAAGVCGYIYYGSSGPGSPAVVGKWLLDEKGSPHGLELRGDGTLRVARFRRLPRPGTWKPTPGGIELNVADGEAEAHTVAVTADTLTLSDGDERKRTVWKRVQALPEEIDHPNGRTSEKQSAWIVGSWGGTMRSTFKMGPHRFDFHPDGTYAHLATDRGLLGSPSVTVRMGTYRLHPGTDNFLDLTSEDTGTTETRFVAVAEGTLSMTDAPEETTLRELARVTEERPEMRTADDGEVRTAFNLYRTVKQDRAKAEAALKGRPVTVHGVVGDSATGGKSAHVYLYTGAKQCVLCDFADPPTVSRLLNRGVRWGRPYRVIVRGTYTGLFKASGRGKLFEMFTGLKIDDSKDPPVARLEKCDLLGAAVLHPPGGKPADEDE